MNWQNLGPVLFNYPDGWHPHPHALYCTWFLYREGRLIAAMRKKQPKRILWIE